MADSVEMADIRGLDIDKTVKGFALVNYIFKSAITNSTTTADHIRWYQETAADLTPTAPTVISDVSPLALFPTLEATWTRNTSYVQKYAAEDTISMEVMKSSDIDVVARTLLRLTRAVVKQVDADIYNVITEDQSPSTISTVASTAAWDAGSGQDPIKDILGAIEDIEDYNYDISQGELWLNPKQKTSLLTWLISTKGASIPQFASEKVKNGVLMEFLGLKVRVSNNVVADSAPVLIPAAAATWKSHTNTTSVAIEDRGIGTKFRVYELGITLLTDPRAVCLITNTDA